MPARVYHLSNVIPLVRRNTHAWKPYAHYFRRGDILRVVIENRPFVIVQTGSGGRGALFFADRGGKRERIIGFEIYGIRNLFRYSRTTIVDPESPIIWKATELVWAVANHLPRGFNALFGDRSHAVRTILKAHDLLVRFG